MCFTVYFTEGGSDSDPCSEYYAGYAAFSEKETEKLSSFIGTIHQQLVIYISFHSYSQSLLIPYGYDSSDRVDNYNLLVS